jgi:hypothetical protein
VGDRKIIYWSLALFFGCSILFAAIDSAASGSGKGVSIGIQAGALVVIMVAIVLIARRRDKK